MIVVRSWVEADDTWLGGRGVSRCLVAISIGELIDKRVSIDSSWTDDFHQQPSPSAYPCHPSDRHAFSGSQPQAGLSFLSDSWTDRLFS